MSLVCFGKIDNENLIVADITAETEHTEPILFKKEDYLKRKLMNMNLINVDKKKFDSIISVKYNKDDVEVIYKSGVVTFKVVRVEGQEYLEVTNRVNSALSKVSMSMQKGSNNSIFTNTIRSDEYSSIKFVTEYNDIICKYSNEDFTYILSKSYIEGYNIGQIYIDIVYTYKELKKDFIGFLALRLFFTEDELFMVFRR